MVGRLDTLLTAPAYSCAEQRRIRFRMELQIPALLLYDDYRKTRATRELKLGWWDPSDELLASLVDSHKRLRRLELQYVSWCVWKRARRDLGCSPQGLQGCHRRNTQGACEQNDVPGVRQPAERCFCLRRNGVFHAPSQQRGQGPELARVQQHL